MSRRIDLPAWAEDIIEGRARAAGITFEEALMASLGLGSTDPLAQTAGWAVTRGEATRAVARRVSYSRSSVESAATRYRRL